MLRPRRPSAGSVLAGGEPLRGRNAVDPALDREDLVDPTNRFESEG